jgi:hypothetical protein
MSKLGQFEIPNEYDPKNKLGIINKRDTRLYCIKCGIMTWHRVNINLLIKRCLKCNYASRKV